MTDALAAQRPLWEPGTRHGYHALTYGWLVGEVVRRITGRSLGPFFRDEIARPFGLDFHIGLPEDDLHRVARLVQRPPDFSRAAGLDPSLPPEPMRELVTAMIDPNSLTRRAHACVDPPFDHDHPAEQTAEIPATNGICTARALPRFYAALIGEVGDHRILDPQTLAAATTPQVTGPDLVHCNRSTSASASGCPRQGPRGTRRPRSVSRDSAAPSVTPTRRQAWRSATS
ncbi:beta-lactamase-like protein [Amycolatopsis mediterranei S699]|uniref:Beta-lactamase-like protein n=2 Tax=Amycolatopsis mediterranei TaxID=33910 RepID=A0A0H3DFT8_AMYMU|nr:serine hydrolase domain-containing protein [Amycolatopsis mediterranei]ADJ49067.1 beta-lactamase-like protein [Amycolatopsis mediterranei U32]AEK46027.1 beta-lactamase-like protein [Amycolatopsis mediterranei S699]AFO80775.1 beta-lactamase-like protein [Amycolatopsis mediterranei S699]AGT87903.1 beta-lactamase-like protein [Amycolatopsis mediterranei RB]KDO04047.1 beta-lactamase [Amycolatopsis mediterranei]